MARRASYAFAADLNLRSLGVVLACGLYWAYYEVDRPMEHLEKTKESDDPDYVPQTENSIDTQSDNSGPSALSDSPAIIFHIPDCINAIMACNKFSFDDVPLCKQAFTQISAHLRACHSQFWGLQGNGKCATCTAIVYLLSHLSHSQLTCIVPTGDGEARACGERARADGQLELQS